MRATDAAGRLDEVLCATTTTIRVVFSIDGDGEMGRWEDGGRILIGLLRTFSSGEIFYAQRPGEGCCHARTMLVASHPLSNDLSARLENAMRYHRSD